MGKRNLFQLFAAAVVIGFAGCSQDDLGVTTPGGEVNPNDAVYMNVTVQLPTGNGTRSVTGENGGSDGGEEVGKNYENNVNSVLLVLAKTSDNSFIAAGEVVDNKTEGGINTSVQKISKSTLASYYKKDGFEKSVNVFVFCNPTNTLRSAVLATEMGNKSWYDLICSISETAGESADNAAIWGGSEHQNGFLMSSASIKTATIPATIEGWNTFNTKDNPFHLTANNPNVPTSSGNGINNGKEEDPNSKDPIAVERSVARFDFKDGSPKTTASNTYEVLKDGEATIVNITLTKMALVNMSKNFYFLRRVSDNGLNETGGEGNPHNLLLCGLEKYSNTTKKGNYVVDTDAAYKKGTSIDASTYGQYFNFCLGNIPAGGDWTINEAARNQWYTSDIATVLNGTGDNKDDWNAGGSDGEYKIWRYVTENTIPVDGNQKKGITTGVVFKGKMVANENADATLKDKHKSLFDALNNTNGLNTSDPILYAIGNQLFVTWKEVRDYLIQNEGNPLYEKVFGNLSEGVKPKAGTGTDYTGAVYSDDESSADYLWHQWFNNGATGWGTGTPNRDEDKLKAFKAAAVAAGFTIYQRSSETTGETTQYGYYCYYFYWNRHNDNGNTTVMGPMEFGVVRNNVYKLSVNSISKLGHPRLSENDPDPEDPDDPDEDGDIYFDVSCQVKKWVVRINGIDF